MGDELAAIGILLALAVLIVPFVSLGLAINARKRISALEAELESRKREARYLYEQVKEFTGGKSVSTPTPVTQETKSQITRPIEPAEDAVLAEQRPARAPITPTAPIVSKVESPPPPPKQPGVPLEQRLAYVFTRVGAASLLGGVIYFFKFAADNEWIGPAGRILIGAIFGVCILGFAEIARKKTDARFIHALVGVGVAILYIAAWASHARYDLVDTSTAFGAGTLILLVGAALAYRHRGEAVLVVVLAAGFANPVLLSTGEDRPFALFTYLFLLTGVTIAVSILREFKFALSLSIIGVAVLFGGWYDKFFSTFDHRNETWAGDVPPEILVGAYAPLTSRLVPLGFASLFAVEWLSAGVFLKRRDSSTSIRHLVKPIAVAALLIAHVLIAALLYDRPEALGSAMLFLAAVTVASLRYFDARRFLLVPMIAAFLLLAALTANTRSEEQTLLLGMLGAWSVLYCVAFVRDTWRSGLSKNAAISAAIALALFAFLALIVLLPSERFVAASVAIAAVSSLVVLLSLRAKLVEIALGWLILAAAILVTLGVCVSDILRREHLFVDYRFIAAVSIIPLVYFAGAIYELITRSERLRLSLVTVSLASLTFVAASISGTLDETPTLRAILTAAMGVADVSLATYVARKRPDLSTWVRILSAQSIALFAPAVAFAHSGATITIVWAILAATSMMIYADARDRLWPFVSIFLIGATIVRVFGFDYASIEDSMQLFRSTYGRLGVFSVPAFINARALALAGSGLAFLGGAFFLGRSGQKNKDRTMLTIAAVIATCGYALLTTFLIVETREFLTSRPEPPPIPLDFLEFEVFMQMVQDSLASQANKLAMTTTVILAVVAMLLLGAGFAAKDPFHRYLGLTLFLGTVGKLALWDVWNLARIHQIVVLSVVGVLLLLSGFLYARLKVLFRGETQAAIGLVLCLSLFGSTANADEPQTRVISVSKFQSQASIEELDGPGDYLLRVPRELFIKSLAAHPLDDVRIIDDQDREVPFIAQIKPPTTTHRTFNARLFDPGVPGAGGFRATFELPPSSEHCEVEMTLDASSSFLQRTRIETGNELRDLATVSEGALVFAVDIQGTQARSTRVRYPNSIARFVRVSLLPDKDVPTARIDGATFFCHQFDTVESREQTPLSMSKPNSNPETQTTEVEFDAGAEGVPIESLTLEVSTKEFVRRIHLSASSFKNVWPPLASTVFYRVGDVGPESTTITFPATRKRYFKLVIVDQNDAPLAINGAAGSYQTHELIVRARAGKHTLFIGDKTVLSPRYDLREIIERRDTTIELKKASLGNLTDNPRFGKDEAPADLPMTERYRSAIGLALLLVLLVLGGWAVRLRNSPSSEG